jgi:aspartyl-tRNA(Asn)/glutamyl-tRNA(Gln) amidotransferase subunit A
MNSALTDLSLTEASALLAQGTVSSLELTRACLARIDALDRQLRTFITLASEGAEADAVRADAEQRAGGRRGPLHGIPFAVKDLFDTAGILSSANSRLQANRIPPTDATVVARLRMAGAVLLGKLHMNEFGFGPLSEDDFRPPSRNPWDLERTPGESSSGSGAALAAGLCFASFGSDTSGSIQEPASYCGVAGLKPTQGRISRHGVATLSWSYDNVGPMARRVADVAGLLQATAGLDPADAASSPEPVPDYLAALDGSVDGMRIGVPTGYIASRSALQPEVLVSLETAVEHLRGLGAEVHEIDLPHIDHLDAIWKPVVLSEVAACHQTRLAAQGTEYGRGFRQRVLEGFFYTGVEYVQAQRGRALMTRGFDALMTTVDLIAMPSTHRTAHPFEEQASSMSRPFMRIFNVTGQPALSICCGFDSEGLPIGLMLAGRRFDEATVLRAADAYERTTPWHERQPQLKDAIVA